MSASTKNYKSKDGKFGGKKTPKTKYQTETAKSRERKKKKAG